MHRITRYGRACASLLALLISAAAPLLADDAPKLPEGGDKLLGDKTPEAYVLRTKKGATGEKTLETADAGLPFTQFTRVKVLEATGKPWDAALDIDLASKVANGDLVFLRFYYRASPGVEPVAAKLTVRLTEWKEPYTKIIEKKVDGTANWQRCDLSLPATSDIVPENSKITFMLGAAKQSMDIAGIELVDYHQAVTKDALPPDGEFPVTP